MVFGSSESAGHLQHKSQKKTLQRPKKRPKVATTTDNMAADTNVTFFLKNLGYQQYASSLAGAGFASMAELSLITAKALKDCNVLEGHSLGILAELEKKRRALDVVPKPTPADCIEDLGGAEFPP